MYICIKLRRDFGVKHIGHILCPQKLLKDVKEVFEYLKEILYNIYIV